mmetsp:Transcript_3046/g.6599  ORF Transcript_3046/g.6599 Transcript_3046/m.6599 type:complete len:220 (-) Transcript_3046:358-1017(-)
MKKKRKKTRERRKHHSDPAFRNNFKTGPNSCRTTAGDSKKRESFITPSTSISLIRGKAKTPSWHERNSRDNNNNTRRNNVENARRDGREPSPREATILRGTRTNSTMPNPTKTTWAKFIKLCRIKLNPMNGPNWSNPRDGTECACRPPVRVILPSRWIYGPGISSEESIPTRDTSTDTQRWKIEKRRRDSTNWRRWRNCRRSRSRQRRSWRFRRRLRIR